MRRPEAEETFEMFCGWFSGKIQNDFRPGFFFFFDLIFFLILFLNFT